MYPPFVHVKIKQYAGTVTAMACFSLALNVCQYIDAKSILFLPLYYRMAITMQFTNNSLTSWQGLSLIFDEQYNIILLWVMVSKIFHAYLKISFADKASA